MPISLLKIAVISRRLSRELGISAVTLILALFRPYHGCLLLENQYPTPDGNPAVQRFLEYNSPDRSFEDLSYVSGMPLLQVGYLSFFTMNVFRFC